MKSLHMLEFSKRLDIRHYRFEIRDYRLQITDFRISDLSSRVLTLQLKLQLVLFIIPKSLFFLECIFLVFFSYVDDISPKFFCSCFSATFFHPSRIFSLRYFSCFFISFNLQILTLPSRGSKY